MNLSKGPIMGSELVQKNHIDKKKSFCYNGIMKNMRFLLV